MQQRLQKIISNAGVASRRASEVLLNAGRVTVNGVVALLGSSADPEIDIVAVDGVSITIPTKKTYIMLNKPRGYVTTMHDEQDRRTVVDLVADAGIRLYPVGRLDMESEGLLILTNDGEVANRLMHPAHHVKKTYLTWVSGADLDHAVAMLKTAMEIDGYRVRPAEVEIQDRAALSQIAVTIGEGRNRQVRKMCAKAGLRVHRLLRISQGELYLGNLESGKWRYLTEQEIQYLKTLQ